MVLFSVIRVVEAGGVEPTVRRHASQGFSECSRWFGDSPFPAPAGRLRISLAYYFRVAY